MRFSDLPVSERKKLAAGLRNVSNRLHKFFGNIAPLPVDVFRGDSWQMIISDPSVAFTVALFFRATLKYLLGSGKFDTRVAIGVGTVDFIPGKHVSEGDGDAFRFSGDALESMDKHVRMHFVIPDKEMERSINVVAHLVDAIAIRWTDKQALAVSGALQGLKQDEIAKLWRPPITQQNVAKHLFKAGWRQIESANQYINYNLNRLYYIITT